MQTETNSHIDNMIEELGIGVQPEENTETPNETQIESENTTDFVQEQQVSNDTEEVSQEETEPKEINELRKQIEVLEKRVTDKDDYINKLREESKAKEESKSDDSVEDTEDDFWDDPVGKFQALEKKFQLQQMQIQETVYANTVDDYWKTVTPDNIKEAAALDSEFAEKFQSSTEPYKVAYEHLTNRNQAKAKESESLREQIRREVMEELKQNSSRKETVPSTTKLGGKPDGLNKDIPDDGFASVFGTY